MSRLIAFLCVAIGSFTSTVAAAPLPKDPPKGMPHFVLQFKSIDGLLEDYGHVHGLIKDVPGAPTNREIEDGISTVFSNWRKGLDCAKPMGGYLTVEADLTKSKPVLLIPVKDRGAFLEMMKNFLPDLNENKDKGVHHGTFQFFGKIDIFFQLKHNYAFLALEAATIEDGTKLPVPGDMFVNDETALVSLRFYVEGVPEEAKKAVRTLLDKFSGVEIPPGKDGIQMMMLMGAIGASDIKDFAHRMRNLVDEAKWASLRLDLDRKTNELSLEFNLAPRKETALGKDIAAFKPKPSRLGGLLDEQTAGGLLLSYGNFGALKLERNAVDEILRDLFREVDLEGGDDARKALAGALIDAIKVNQADVAVALKNSPNKETYTLVVGAKLNQPALLATSMFGYLQTLPEKKRGRFKLAALKLDGDVLVHLLSLPALPDQVKQIFGASDLYFMVKDETVFAAFGADAVERLKECLKLQPKDGPQFLVEMNHAKLTGLARIVATKDDAERWAKFFPKEQKVRLLIGHVEGGPALRVRYATDLIPLLRMGFGALH